MGRPFPGGLAFRRTLNAAEAVAYLEKLNMAGKMRYEFRATEADPALVAAVVREFGNFQLYLIPPTLLRGIRSGNAKRRAQMLTFLDTQREIGLIPPIMVKGTSVRCLLLLDGHTRAEVSHSLGRPILGYIPEKIIPLLPGVEIVN